MFDLSSNLGITVLYVYAGGWDPPPSCDLIGCAVCRRRLQVAGPYLSSGKSTWELDERGGLWI